MAHYNTQFDRAKNKLIALAISTALVASFGFLVYSVIS